MLTSQYDYIIIGAGRNSPSPLTLTLSGTRLPRGEGNRCFKNKALALSTRAYQATTLKFSISLKCESRETSVKLC